MGKEYRLKDLFLSRPNQEIGLPEILTLNIAQYGRAVHDLRREGMNIINHKEWDILEQQWHSWFKYIPSKEAIQDKEVEVIAPVCFEKDRQGQFVLKG